MKLRNLLFPFIAAAVLLTGCKEEVDYGIPDITVTPSSVAFETSAAADQTVTLHATRDWKVSDPDAVDWIRVTPESGTASLDDQKVTISVLQNTGADREATITFTIGLSKQSVTVSQPGEQGGITTGDGTEASPYTVAGAQALIETLAPDVSSEEVYISGIISEIKEVSTSFGNATYNISDDGTTTGQLLVYRGYYLGGEKFASESQIKVGDKVVVYGTVVNFKGNTPEVNQGNRLISINGQTSGGDTPDPVGNPEGDGTEASPYNVAATQAAASKLEKGETTENEVYIKGKVSTINEISTQYGNATYFISDDGTKSGEFEVFRGKYLQGEKFVSEDQLQLGDELVICGKLTNYNGILEVTESKIISLNGSTQDDTKRFSVSTANLKVSAEAESATFKVSGNVEWTATVTEGADWGVKILSGESGSGAGDVVLELTKNESEENARTAKITVTTTAEVATKTYEVVLTQAKKSSGEPGDYVIDVLNLAWTGVSGTIYTDWSDKTATSPAVYAGQSAGDKESIQLRSKNNNSGIVTTTSGGKARKIVLTWNEGTINTGSRQLDIYGKSTAYTNPTDLYDSALQGTLLGSIVCGTDTELVIDGDYEFIGMRSKNGAIYITEIQISWE